MLLPPPPPPAGSRPSAWVSGCSLAGAASGRACPSDLAGSAGRRCRQDEAAPLRGRVLSRRPRSLASLPVGVSAGSGGVGGKSQTGLRAAGREPAHLFKGAFRTLVKPVIANGAKITPKRGEEGTRPGDMRVRVAAARVTERRPRPAAAQRQEQRSGSLSWGPECEPGARGKDSAGGRAMAGG